jgi:hypothetical protein
VRTLVFISHANPEDNRFTKWLALQLAREGYRVWCDLTRLLGGEDFWNDIEQALREETVKFVYVTSRVSNKKPGVLSELQIAKAVEKQTQLARFIVPLKVDDIPHADFNIQLNRLNTINCYPNWATGLQDLLKLLREDNVPKDERYSPSAVANWWSRDTRVTESILPTVETYLSNWFKVKSLPDNLYLHPIEDVPDATKEIYPLREFNEYYLSFSPQLLHSDADKSVALSEFMQGHSSTIHAQWRDAQNIVSDLLRQAWDGNAAVRGLEKYELANKHLAMYFKLGLADKDYVSATGAASRLGKRKIVGERRRTAADGTKRTSYWHFAIEGRPQSFPEWYIAVYAHVFFSNDGQEIWPSVARLHTARRRQCRSWWNPHWRDRLLGTVRWLATDSVVRLQVGPKEFVEVTCDPTTFESPVSYRDPNRPLPQDDSPPSDDEDEDEEEEEL